MGFGQAFFKPSGFCRIPIGNPDIRVCLLQPLVHGLSHNPHKRGVPVRFCPPDKLEIFWPADLFLVNQRMVFIMPGFTKGNQVVWCIAAGFPAFQVVDLQDLITAFLLAVFTGMLIPEQDIFTDIGKSLLPAILVFHSLDIRVLQFLRVKPGGFNDNRLYRQNRAGSPDDIRMAADLLFNAGCDPSIWFRMLPVKKAGRTVSCLPVSPGFSCLASGGDIFGNICSKPDIPCEKFLRFCRSGQADMAAARIYAQSYGLDVRFGIVKKLDGKRIFAHDLRFFVLKQMADLAKAFCRH